MDGHTKLFSGYLFLAFFNGVFVYYPSRLRTNTNLPKCRFFYSRFCSATHTLSDRAHTHARTHTNAHDYPVTRLIARYTRVPFSPHKTDCPETGRAAEIPFIIDSTTSSAVSPVNRDQRFLPKSATRICYTLLLRPRTTAD